MIPQTITETDEQAAMSHDDYRRELGNGLVVRWSAPHDLERVCDLYAQVFRPSPESPPGWMAPRWARDMFSGQHPHIGPRDFAIVEDTITGAIVASTCLLRYTCAYEGIPFGFGRPELVATREEYRKRGLIRAIFELIHAKSAARGDLVQGITGIDYYYRQFGYEYAAEHLDQGITIYFSAIPALLSGKSEPCTLQVATVDDIPLLRLFALHAHQGTALWTEIDADYWRWAIAGAHPDALEGWRVYRIMKSAGQEGESGRAVGAVVLRPRRHGPIISVTCVMLDEGVPMVQVLPSVVRGVQGLAETVRPAREAIPPAAGLTLRWATPALKASLADIAFADVAYPWAWYLRVADLPRFLKHITPALERRLDQSAQAGYTGELTLDFYRGGLRLVLDRGKLASAENWERPVWGEGNAAFPPLVFLQLLFGYRSLDELRRIYPDVVARGDAVALLEALFPPRPSFLIPLD